MFRRAAANICVVALMTPLLGSIAQAAPSATAYKGELDKLSTQISTLDEQYNQAQIRLTKVQRQIRENETGKTQADDQLKALRGTASKRAAANYRAGFPGVLLVFFGSGSISDFLQRMGAVSKIGHWENGLVSSLQLANEHADHRTEDLKAALANQRAINRAIEAKQNAVQSKISEQHALLTRLASAAAKGANLGAAAPLVSKVQLQPPALAATKTSNDKGPAVVTSLTPAKPAQAPAAASGGAKTALQTAFAHMGNPYVYGAAGPNSFDCSGLTMFSWNAAGVSLPHSAEEQYAVTRHVSRAEIQPGDLVFFGSPIHHVGMYSGNGNMIDAPETGEVVTIKSIDRSDFVGASRPGA